MIVARVTCAAIVLLATAGQAVAEGDPALGRRLVAMHGCTACHVVPGLRGPRSHVGPPLRGVGAGRYIAGILPNTPQNMRRWLRDPPAIAPGTAMPRLGLDEAEARHITAFLATLR